MEAHTWREPVARIVLLPVAGEGVDVRDTDPSAGVVVVAEPPASDQADEPRAAIGERLRVLLAVAADKRGALLGGDAGVAEAYAARDALAGEDVVQGDLNALAHGHGAS